MEASGAKRTAFILAGGLGTRLSSAIGKMPKVLAMVAGRPFICHLLDQVRRAGFDSAVLCTGYLAEMVQETIGDEHQGLPVLYSREHERLGTGGAVRLAFDFLPGDKPANLLVMNGDSFCGADLRALWDSHVEREAAGTLLLKGMDDTACYGKVSLDRGGNITQFVEKASAAGPGLINAGVYVLSREMLRSIAPGKNVSIEYDVFPRWVGKGLMGYESDAPFIDIGTPETLIQAQQVLTEHSG